MLLRRLLEALPQDALTAYADDMGLVANDIFASAAVFVPIFAEFASISGLRLNVRKTISVPLGDASLSDFKAALEARAPGWGAAPVRLWADYLGFVLGPEAGDHIWEKAFAKVEARSALWAQLGLGLHLSSVAYNVYIASLLGFLLQLAVLPSSWPALEAATFRKMVPGPGYWLLPSDLHDLRRTHGLPHNFQDLNDVSLAARFRVVHREAVACGGLQVSAAVRRLDALFQATPFLYRSGRWRQWYLSSFYHNLHAAVATCRTLGITIETVETELGAANARPHTPSQMRRLDKGVQRTARWGLVEGSQTASRAAPPAQVRALADPRVSADPGHAGCPRDPTVAAIGAAQSTRSCPPHLVQRLVHAAPLSRPGAVYLWLHSRSRQCGPLCLLLAAASAGTSPVATSDVGSVCRSWGPFHVAGASVAVIRRGLDTAGSAPHSWPPTGCTAPIGSSCLSPRRTLCSRPSPRL